MGKRKLTEKEENKKLAERKLVVAKRDDMLQHSRHNLTVQEYRCVSYVLAKIKPTDTAFTEYIFDLKDFYSLCGLKSDSYNHLKKTLKGIRDKSWYIKKDDGSETTVSWFAKVTINNKKQTASILLDNDLMPYFLELSKQQQENNIFFTQFNLNVVLPMKSQYSSRLYEVLKSYQKNNDEWYFEPEELKYLLDCQNYKNWKDFRVRALEPAIEEINTFGDIKVGYSTELKGKKVVRVIFFMAKKNKEALYKAQSNINKVLEGETFEERNERIIKAAEENLKNTGFVDDRSKFFSENKNEIEQ